MVLNYIFIFFFLAAFAVALYRLLVLGDTAVFTQIITGTFDSAKTAFEVAIGLTGVLTLWLGLMKVGEAGGMITLLGRLFGPFFSRLFPGIPKGHPAGGSIMMNFGANMLGLDNAATPLGLKAMKEMQELNETPDTATNAQIMFLVINTAGLTIIPISIMVYRAQLGAANPADVFLPILLATAAGTFTGLIAVALYQRINLFQPVILAYLGGFLALIGGLMAWFTTLSREELGAVSALIGNGFLFTLIVFFVGFAFIRKVNVYENFIEGAKDGFNVAIRIIPYLVAILVAIGVFRAAGAMDLLIGGARRLVAALGMDTRFVDALPTAMMKPLSGSGARGMMVDTMKAFGADSFQGRLACIFQGSTDTTLFILAVYFGSVNIKNTRYAVTCGLIADAGSFFAAIPLAYFFFG